MPNDTVEIAKVSTRLDGLETNVGLMREENRVAHQGVRNAISEGLSEVHRRIDKMQEILVTRWLAAASAVILILLGATGWLISKLIVTQ